MIAQSPAQLVDMIQNAVIKSRSNAAESGTLEDSEILWPRLYGTGVMSIMDVSMRMQKKGQDVDALDAANLTTLLRQLETGETIYWLRWQEELPDMMTIMAAWAH